MAAIMGLKDKVGMTEIQQNPADQETEYTVNFKELKDYLYSVKESEKKVDFLKRRISFWLDALGTGSDPVGKPKDGTDTAQVPMEARNLNVAQLEKELAEAEAYLKVNRIKVCELISHLDNAGQRDVMLMKYIDLMTWDEIAGRLGITARRAQKLHGKALPLLDEELAQMKDRNEENRLSVWNGQIIKGHPPIQSNPKLPRLR